VPLTQLPGGPGKARRSIPVVRNRMQSGTGAKESKGKHGPHTERSTPGEVKNRPLVDIKGESWERGIKYPQVQERWRPEKTHRIEQPKKSNPLAEQAVLKSRTNKVM